MFNRVVLSACWSVGFSFFNQVNATPSIFYPTVHHAQQSSSVSYNERLRLQSTWETATDDLEAMKATLATLVEIPTAKHRFQSQDKNPNIQKFGREIEKIAKNFGLDFKNYKNMAFEVYIKGDGSKGSIGLYTHADVVPANAAEWQTPDGKRIQPYKLTPYQDRLYGRGVLDDKGAIVAALYTLKHIREHRIPLTRDIRLIITANEETTGKGIEYFKSLGHLPEYNIGLDSSYPIVVAEHGAGSIHLRIKDHNTNLRTPTTPPVIELIAIEGSHSNNSIPRQSTAMLKVLNSKLSPNKEIHQAIAKYLQQEKASLAMKVNPCGKSYVCVQAIGHSAHASQPEAAVNPVAHLMKFVQQLSTKLTFKQNTILRAVALHNSLFGMDYYGRKLNINYRSKMMGPLILTLTEAYQNKNNYVLGYNLRIPDGNDPQVLRKKILTKLTRYQKTNGIEVEADIDIGLPMKRDPNSPLVKKLQHVYQLVTTQPAKLVGIRGYTEIHELPNGISFGPNLAGVTYQGHQASEYIYQKDLVYNQVMLLNALQALEG
jgi:predicted dipeptidase